MVLSDMFTALGAAREPQVELYRDCSAGMQRKIWDQYTAGNNQTLYKAGGTFKLKVQESQARTLRFIAKRYYKTNKQLVRRKVQNELAVAANLAHPGIVRYYSTLDFGNHMLIFMEHCGTTLEDLVDENNIWEERDVTTVMQQVTQALAYLHKQNIVHRDVKPANIGVSSSGVAKLFDFGESFQMKDLDTQQGCSKTGIAGTAPFMAPEALLRYDLSEKINAETVRVVNTKALDIWGLGCVAFFLLTGRAPIDDDDVDELEDITHWACNLEANLRFPPALNISPEAQDFVRKCLKRNPLHRASSEELLNHPWIASEVAHPRVQPKDDIVSSLEVSTGNSEAFAEIVMKGKGDKEKGIKSDAKPADLPMGFLTKLSSLLRSREEKVAPAGKTPIQIEVHAEEEQAH